jgi:hypothetical protein
MTTTWVSFNRGQSSFSNHAVKRDVVQVPAKRKGAAKALPRRAVIREVRGRHCPEHRPDTRCPLGA